MADLYRSDICKVDISKSLVRSYAGIVLATGDKNANRFGAIMYRGNEPVNLTGQGVAVMGYFIRPNAETVIITGTVDGNTVYVDLPEACYTASGSFSLAIKVSSTEITQTVRVVDGCIRLTQTDTLVDPGEVVPSLDDLFAHIAEMEAVMADMQAATEATREATDTANAAAVDNAAKTDDAIQTMQAKSDDAIANVHATLGEALEGVAEVLADVAPGINIHASGGLLTMTDAAAHPVQALVSQITPQQSGSGDPSPDNIRPVTGWDAVKLTRTGRNLVSHLDGKSTSGNVSTIITDDLIDVTNPTSMDYITIPVHLKAGVTYTLWFEHEVYGRDEDSTLLSACRYGLVASSETGIHDVRANGVYTYTQTYTGTEDTETTIRVYPNYGNSAEKGYLAACARVRVMMVEGAYTLDTMPPFEPGTRHMLTAALPETVYGGTLDWTTGLLTVTHACTTLDGTEAWKARNEGAATGYFYVTIGASGYVVNDSGACSHYPFVNITSSNTVVGARVGNLSIGDASIVLRPAPDIASVSDLQAYLAEQSAAGTPVTVVYELASPHTIQLTPQQLDLLKGYNALWCDAGDTALTYVADTKLYIDNKFTALQNAILAQGANI